MSDPSTVDAPSQNANAATTTTEPVIKDPEAKAEQDHAAREHEVEIAIEAATGFPVPPDWQDPLARSRQRGILQDAARQAARAQVELLAQARLCADRGATLQPGDPVVGAMCDALVGLHRALWAYQHDTLLYDGGEVVTNAMEDEAGGGIAALILGLLERLREDLDLAIRQQRGDLFVQ